MMKFDVIIGNSPYQVNDGGGAGDSSRPIYNLFIEKSIDLLPNYISMIVPSRWMNGGKGLNKFRSKLIKDKRFSHFFDFQSSSEIFKGVNIDGGICYFLWNSKHNGEVDYTYSPINGNKTNRKRYLNNGLNEKVIRDNRALSIIEKSTKFDSFSNIVSKRNPFGINADYFNNEEKYKDYKIGNNLINIFGVKGIKGGAKRVNGVVNRDIIDKNKNMVDGYKIFFSKAFGTNYINPPQFIVSDFNDVCTETFLNIGNFKNREEQKNCSDYMNSKIFKFLLYMNRSSINITQSSFEYIPIIDFSENFDENKLYRKLNLTNDEVEFINSFFKW